MRSLSSVALFVLALAAAAPAAAQVSSPGPVWHNQSGAPIPGAPGAPHTSPRYDPPAVQTGGPVYYNQSGNPIPGGPHMRGDGPQRTGGPLYAGPQGGDRRVQQNGRWVSMPATGHGYNGGNRDRWGQSVNGRWWGGSQAPGGWGGYRRPRRGGSLDHYWMQPDFQIPDYLSFGLASPPYGTFWVRYYDDAVLVDAQGSVQASVSGIAWASASASAGDGYASSSASASASGYGGGYGQQGGPIGYVDPNPPYYSEPQGGYAPPAPYGQPAVQSQYYQGCPNVCPPQVYSQQGGGYGYQGGGYYGGGSTTTTVVIQPGPMVTTTIIEEEIVTEEVVTTSYVRSAPRRVVRRAPHRAKPRPARRQCGCQCVCR